MKQIKKPFIRNPQIDEIIETIDSLIEQNETFGSSPSMLLTGEAGCGKSEIARRYVEKYPPIQESERLHIPAIHIELKSVGSQKDLYKALLRAIKDPQNGERGKNADELLERFGGFAQTVGLKILFIDEIQVAIERRSQKVLSNLADSFKDVLKWTNVPVVFIGVPWARYLIEANEQLNTRVAYRRYLSPFKISDSESFKDYRKALALLGKHYGEDGGFRLSNPEIALRVFCFTSGLYRTTINLIEAAYVISSKNNSCINASSLARAVRTFGVSDDENPFLMDLYDLRLEEQVQESDWSFNYRKKESPIIKPHKAVYIVQKTGQLTLKESA